MPKKKARPKAAPKAQEAEKRGRGRPAFEPTDKQRGIVEALTAAGFNQTVIAGYPGLKIDEKTLREYFRDELDFGLTKMLAGAVNNLGRFAMGAPAVYDDKGNLIRAEVKPEAWAICFLLKTKGKHLGFSERVELVGKDGGAIEHKHEVVDDVQQLIREELGEKPRATKH